MRSRQQTNAHATQAHTELAETPGTGFRDECLTLVAEARYGELLDRWLGQFEMLLSRAQDKGALSSVGLVRVLARAGLGPASLVGMLGMWTPCQYSCVHGWLASAASLSNVPARDVPHM